MTRTITLPIKCSTVKKLDNVLFWILVGEVVTIALSSIPTWICLSHVGSEYPGDFIFVYLIVSMLCFMAVCVVAIKSLPELLQKLPKFDCIKDEGDEKP
jgi:hypothetical protein